MLIACRVLSKCVKIACDLLKVYNFSAYIFKRRKISILKRKLLGHTLIK